MAGGHVLLSTPSLSYQQLHSDVKGEANAGVCRTMLDDYVHTGSGPQTTAQNVQARAGRYTRLPEPCSFPTKKWGYVGQPWCDEPGCKVWHCFPHFSGSRYPRNLGRDRSTFWAVGSGSPFVPASPLQPECESCVNFAICLSHPEVAKPSRNGQNPVKTRTAADICGHLGPGPRPRHISRWLGTLGCCKYCGTVWLWRACLCVWGQNAANFKANCGHLRMFSTKF
jgi:hypothetical protein